MVAPTKRIPQPTSVSARATLSALALILICAAQACGRFATGDCTETATCAAENTTCASAPFTPDAVDTGTVCGVGACRKIVGTCPVEAGSPCTGLFPPETCGNGLDDDCDGVIDNGCAGEAAHGASAGFECASCAVGLHVKLDGSGTPTGLVGDPSDYFTTAACINTGPCTLPGPAWVRNVAGRGVTCTSFCASVGATCKPQCIVQQGPSPNCDPAAASVNQGGKPFGTYAIDYRCLQVDGAGNPTGTPNTGDCDFSLKALNKGFGPEPTGAFNVVCCCAF